MVELATTPATAANEPGEGRSVAFEVKVWQKPNGGVFIYLAVMVAALLANLAPLVKGDVHSFLIGLIFIVPGFLVLGFVFAFGPPLLVNGVVDSQGVRGTSWWGKALAVSWDDVKQGALRVPRNKPTDPPFALVLHPRSAPHCMIGIPKGSYPPEVRLGIEALQGRGVEILNIDRLSQIAARPRDARSATCIAPLNTWSYRVQRWAAKRRHSGGF
jgi:hypothetical protein